MDTQQFLDRYDFIRDVRDDMPKHVTRVWRRRNLFELVGMVWHQALGEGSVQGIARYHVGANHISRAGLPGISYTFFIEPDGDCLMCNDLEDTTFSQGDRTQPGDENRMYVAACFSGNFDAPGYEGTSRVTAYQIASGIRLWLACAETFEWDGTRLLGHYHMGKAVCPGSALSSLIDTVRGDPTRRAQPIVDLSSPKLRQEALQKLGYYAGAVDGIWGIESRRALARYQADRGLTVDGIWGPESREALSHDA
jgi:hypothetical protein